MSFNGDIGWIDSSTISGIVGARGERGEQGVPGANATATNPLTNNLVVFGSTSTSPPEYKSADTVAVIAHPLRVSAPSDVASDVNGLVVQANQSATSGKSVRAYITNTAADSSSAALALGKLGTSAWEWYVDPDHTNEDKIVLKTMNGSTRAISVAALDMMVEAVVGYKAPRYDVTTSSVSPSSISMWRHTDGGLRDGTRCVLTDITPTVPEAIPVYTGVSGQVDTTSSSTAATLGRPITITTPIRSSGNSYPMIAQGTINGVGRVYFQTLNNAAGNSSAGLFFGKPFIANSSLTWEMGTDQTCNNYDNMYIRHNKTNKYCLTIGPDDIVTMTDAVKAPRLELVASAANPGTAAALWLDSADPTRPMLGANKLALLSDIPSGGSTINTSVPFDSASDFGTWTIMTTSNVLLFRRDGESVHMTLSPNSAEPGLTLKNVSGTSSNIAEWTIIPIDYRANTTIAVPVCIGIALVQRVADGTWSKASILLMETKIRITFDVVFANNDQLYINPFYTSWLRNW